MSHLGLVVKTLSVPALFINQSAVGVCQEFSISPSGFNNFFLADAIMA